MLFATDSIRPIAIALVIVIFPFFSEKKKEWIMHQNMHDSKFVRFRAKHKILMNFWRTLNPQKCIVQHLQKAIQKYSWFPGMLDMWITQKNTYINVCRGSLINATFISMVLAITQFTFDRNFCSNNTVFWRFYKGDLIGTVLINTNIF